MSHQRAALYPLILQARSSLKQVILGNEQSIDLALAGVLAGGHCLIEGDNGTGKTTLAKALAKLINSDSRATQIHQQTAITDLIRLEKTGKKTTGPMAQSIFIAEDMGDSSSAITQSIQQAMTERCLLVDTKHLALADDFQVLATQHRPNELPSNVNDRFLMRVALARLNREAERHMFRQPQRTNVLADIGAVFSSGDLTAIKQAVQAQYTSPHLLDYIQNIIEFTHESDELSAGLSNHGALALLNAAKAYSLLQGRDHVFPEDVQAVLSATVDHRLTLLNSDYPTPSQLIIEKALLTWWAFG